MKAGKYLVVEQKIITDSMQIISMKAGKCLVVAQKTITDTLQIIRLKASKYFVVAQKTITDTFSGFQVTKNNFSTFYFYHFLSFTIANSSGFS
jgi:hypothetical protein